MAGVYISWPFCAQKCTYCNFASGVHAKGTEVEYADALVREIAAHPWSFTPHTVFLGGGTPSAADPTDIARVLRAVPGAPWVEATLECAPGSFDDAKILQWVDAGINRVSLGVQSFVKRELARTGRRHDADIVRRDISMLQARGLHNINIDLIAGLPGQTSDSWDESLNAALELDVPHVSVYMLEVDENSRLGSEIILGGPRYGAGDVPGEDDVAAFYERAVDRFSSQQIHRYEISNFARAGFESVHNLKYWRREPYAGFGSDAHSFDGVRRWQNPESVHEYVSGASRVCESVPDADEERFFVGLRLTEGVTPAVGDWQRFGPAFDRFIAEGVLEQIGERLRLTPRGVMVSNEVFQEFISA